MITPVLVTRHSNWLSVGIIPGDDLIAYEIAPLPNSRESNFKIRKYVKIPENFKTHTDGQDGSLALNKIFSRS